MKDLAVGDGEIHVRDVRMCLFDVANGFLTLRRSVENALGEVSAVLLYNAGFASFRGDVSAASADVDAVTGEAAFRASIASYRAAGFGGFEVVDFDAAAGRARVQCAAPVAFEAYAVVRRREGELKPVCDYSRGALAGLFAAATGRADRLCIETECVAKGDARCLFEIGDEKALTARLLRGP